MTPLSNALCFTHTTSGSPTSRRTELGHPFQRSHGLAPGSSPGSGERGRTTPPCAEANRLLPKGSGSPLRTARPLAQVAAGAVCAAGLPSSGRRGRRRRAARWEPPEAGSQQPGGNLLLDVAGSARRGPGARGLRTVPPNLSLLVASQRSQGGCAPRPDCHGDRLYPPLPPRVPCPESGAGGRHERPPRREPAARRSGAHEQRGSGTLAAGRVKFLGRHRGAVRSRRALPTPGSWLWDQRDS